MDLDILDYKILEFAANEETFTAKDISQKFDIELNVAEMRLARLAKIQEYVTVNGRWSTPSLQTRLITLVNNTRTFKITTFGRSVLKNYLIHKADENWKKWEDRIWKFIPIVLSTLALIISFMAYANTHNVEKYITIEVKSDTRENINGIQSSSVFDSKNSLEKNGIQQKK